MTLLNVVLAAVAGTSVRGAPHLFGEFSQWGKKFGKEYTSVEERLQRFEVWGKNRAMIETHNAEADLGLHTFRLALNHLGDLSHEEYRSTMLGFRQRRPTLGAHVSKLDRVSADEAPDSWDWRSKGVVNAVKDQAQCGSCWAFSAVAAMEGAYNWKSNGTVPNDCVGNTCGPENTPCCSFSEQELVDCVKGGADNCNVGGEMKDGIEEIAKRMKGVFNTEEEYPYTSGGGQSLGKCHAKVDGVATGISGFSPVTQGDEEALKIAAWKQPVIAVAIDASQQSFQFYSSGIYVEPRCKNGEADLDHGVAVVGYGTGKPGPSPPGPPGPAPDDCVNYHDADTCQAEPGCNWCEDMDFCMSLPCAQSGFSSFDAKRMDYWIVRNSWGESYGMDGYVLMARNRNNQCGIATNAIYANIGSGSIDSTQELIV